MSRIKPDKLGKLAITIVGGAVTSYALIEILLGLRSAVDSQPAKQSVNNSIEAISIISSAPINLILLVAFVIGVLLFLDNRKSPKRGRA